MKRRDINTKINILDITLCVILVILIFVVPQEKVLLGVFLRGAFSFLIIYNALYLALSDKPSFIIRKGKEKHRKLYGVLLLIVGLFVFITFLMGYGVNGYPLLDWRTIFSAK